jgi:putative membrane protein
MKPLNYVLCLAGAASMAVMLGCENNRPDTAMEDSAKVTSPEPAESQVSSADRDFVGDITVANMAEIELGKIAAERGVNAEVKKFGQMMVDDHTDAGEKLQEVASREDIVPPTALDQTHRDLVTKLAALKGAEFDRQYIDAMVDGHEDVIDALESRLDAKSLSEWATSATDWLTGKTDTANPPALVPEQSDNMVTMSLNQWSATVYPTVRRHLETARRIDSTLDRRTPTN